MHDICLNGEYRYCRRLSFCNSLVISSKTRRALLGRR